MSILEKIKQLCKERNISVAALEDELDLGRSTIRCWDKSSPSVKNLKLVADYFGITLDSIVEGTKL